MRRVILAIATTAVALVLLLTFKTQTQSAVPASPPAAVVGSPSPASPSPASPSPGGTGGPSPTGRSPGTSGVTRALTGKAVQTVYGPVQVKVIVTDGRITAATALQYPQGTQYGAQINSYAIPQLNRAAVAAGNAKINAVSGATYTSGGYIASLQSALDQLA